jgi:hypothetical protein
VLSRRVRTRGCNQNCTEPRNFAFVQTNGVPPGPPSPQESDDSTLTPNRQTLLLNPGDLISIHLFDARIPGGHALEAGETDLSTGHSGFMIASRSSPTTARPSSSPAVQRNPNC